MSEDQEELEGLCEGCGEEWKDEAIGWQCDCGGYIWAKGDNDESC